MQQLVDVVVYDHQFVPREFLREKLVEVCTNSLWHYGRESNEYIDGIGGSKVRQENSSCGSPESNDSTAFSSGIKVPALLYYHASS